jgi:hypothetical protein
MPSLSSGAERFLWRASLAPKGRRQAEFNLTRYNIFCHFGEKGVFGWLAELMRYTAILSMSRVLPSFAAARSLIGPSPREAMGPKVSAWRASK